MTPAFLAVPGDLDTPTGGYAYARRVLAEAAAAGWRLRHLPLPGGFPHPTAAALEEAGRRLAALPAETPVIVDGLALGALPQALLQRVGAPVVALCHHPLARETGLAPSEADRLARTERSALAEAAVVVATSNATAEELRRDYGVMQVEAAPPGTDPRPAAVGSGGPELAILSVGTLVPRKGHARLLKALAHLSARGWRCRIVGADDRDPSEARRILGLIEDLGLERQVVLTGALDSETVGRLYARADVFALASVHEGFGMVYAEAIAHGLPTLGPDIAPVREATAGGAWLVPPDETGAWAAALDRLISDADARAGWAARARDAARRLPRWSDTLAALMRAVDRAMQR